MIIVYFPYEIVRFSFSYIREFRSSFYSFLLHLDYWITAHSRSTLLLFPLLIRETRPEKADPKASWTCTLKVPGPHLTWNPELLVRSHDIGAGGGAVVREALRGISVATCVLRGEEPRIFLVGEPLPQKPPSNSMTWILSDLFAFRGTKPAPAPCVIWSLRACIPS